MILKANNPLQVYPNFINASIIFNIYFLKILKPLNFLLIVVKG